MGDLRWVQCFAMKKGLSSKVRRSRVEWQGYVDGLFAGSAGCGGKDRGIWGMGQGGGRPMLNSCVRVVSS